LAKERGVSVIWKSFELRPIGVDVPPKSPEYMERAWKNVDALAKSYGLSMQRNTESKHSRLAHEGAKFAEQQQKADAYIRAVFEAQWCMNQDVNDVEVLAPIAQSLGLDEQAFRDALDHHTFEGEVLKDAEDASAMGIHSIPCFIVGSQGVMGVQSKENLQHMLTGRTF
jgi:predicted DsbA family dithiol-disulfide isomerase